METLREVFDPNFLLRNSVYISVVFGLTCPLVGVYLVLRRLVFMGVALPQISSCGIAFAFRTRMRARESTPWRFLAPRCSR
jgi:ABC-type Mn2+/Zn2+ transport system permease subunit